MIRCMEWFADHPEHWSGMGTASLENIVCKYETLYEKVLADAPLERDV